MSMSASSRKCFLPFLRRLGFIGISTLLSLPCLGQSAWDSTRVTGNFSTFHCRKIDLDGISVENIKNEDPRETRRHYDISSLGFAFVSILSHDAFLDAFKSAFSKERVARLSEMKDQIILILYVDEKGEILRIVFLLENNTTITPMEIEVLEQELLSRVKFTPVGKKVDDRIFHAPAFTIWFSEIANGEIRSVRGSEKLKEEVW